MQQIHNYPELHYEVSNIKHVLFMIMVLQQNDYQVIVNFLVLVFQLNTWTPMFLQTLASQSSRKLSTLFRIQSVQFACHLARDSKIGRETLSSEDGVPIMRIAAQIKTDRTRIRSANFRSNTKAKFFRNAPDFRHPRPTTPFASNYMLGLQSILWIVTSRNIWTRVNLCRCIIGMKIEKRPQLLRVTGT